MSENDSREESLPFNSPHINLFSTASIEINQLQENLPVWKEPLLPVTDFFPSSNDYVNRQDMNYLT